MVFVDCQAFFDKEHDDKLSNLSIEIKKKRFRNKNGGVHAKSITKAKGLCGVQKYL